MAARVLVALVLAFSACFSSLPAAAAPPYPPEALAAFLLDEPLLPNEGLLDGVDDREVDADPVFDEAGFSVTLSNDWAAVEYFVYESSELTAANPLLLLGVEVADPDDPKVTYRVLLGNADDPVTIAALADGNVVVAAFNRWDAGPQAGLGPSPIEAAVVATVNAKLAVDFLHRAAGQVPHGGDPQLSVDQSGLTLEEAHTADGEWDAVDTEVREDVYHRFKGTPAGSVAVANILMRTMREGMRVGGYEVERSASVANTYLVTIRFDDTGDGTSWSSEWVYDVATSRVEPQDPLARYLSQPAG